MVPLDLIQMGLAMDYVLVCYGYKQILAELECQRLMQDGSGTKC